MLFNNNSEFGPSYKSDCLPWITANCPEVLGEAFLAKKLAGASIEDSKEVCGIYYYIDMNKLQFMWQQTINIYL